MNIGSTFSPTHYQYQLSESQRAVISSSTAISQASNNKVAQVKESLMLYAIDGNQRSASLKGRMLDTFA